MVVRLRLARTKPILEAQPRRGPLLRVRRFLPAVGSTHCRDGLRMSDFLELHGLQRIPGVDLKEIQRCRAETSMHTHVIHYVFLLSTI